MSHEEAHAMEDNGNGNGNQNGDHGSHHDDHGDHGHHELNFIQKYIFSLDHKTISKQFLITGIFWGLIGGFMSVLFRLQIGWPDETFPFMEWLLGSWAEGGKLVPAKFPAKKISTDIATFGQ